VKQIKWVTDDPLAVYEAIAGEDRHKRDRRVFSRLRRRIENAYKRYQFWKPNLHRLRALGAQLSAREQAALLRCYKGAHIAPRSKSPRDKLYAEIRKRAAECPYCTIGPTKTLDHYLPKQRYPEFAVLTINLVPSCSSCNSSRDFRTRSGERALIHPYFDTIPDERLLFAEIRVAAGQPDVTFDVINWRRTANPTFAQLYGRHVTLLRLRKRYRRWALSSAYGLDAIASTITVWSRGKSRDEVRRILEEQAGKDELKHGANHFKVVLHRAAAASDEFLDYCLGSRP